MARDGRSDDVTARSRERFLAGGPVVAGVRSEILSSWSRCQSLGLRPSLGTTYLGEPDLDTELVHAAEPVLDEVARAIAGTWSTVILTDGEGVVLRCLTGEPQMTRYLDTAGGGAPGFSFHESLGGTTSIGLALAERRASRVYGHEHFADAWTVQGCVAVPVHEPLSGRIVGVVDLATESSEFTSMLETMARKAAHAIERRLLEQKTDRERTLLRAYMRTARQMRAPEFRDGRQIVLGAPAEDLLTGSDRLVLEEKAAGLIASGRRAAIEVPVSGGRVVTLLARPVADVCEGVAVEVIVPASGALVSAGGTPASAPCVPRTDTAETAPGAWRGPPTAIPAHTAIPAPTAAPSATAGEGQCHRWLLAVGEPGIGRLALAARRRLELLRESSRRIGTTLDVVRTAEELAEVVVENFADVVTVDLYPAVLRGDEPSLAGVLPMQRAAVGGVEGFPFSGVGEQIGFAPTSLQAQCLASGSPSMEADLKTSRCWAAEDPVRASQILDRGIHSLITVPLSARGVPLGMAGFYRSRRSAPFEDDDVSLAAELVACASLCIDNARRYTREHATALALQRSLLPHGLPEQNALEVAYRYLPAHTGVSGDWFDVIPLSGARIALVVGDVVGHGVQAAATMGRLRTAVDNFASFELAPDELLTHLDDLVARMAREDGSTDAFIGATCLYGVYDPTTRRCSLSRAGHLPPALISGDGTVTFPEVPAAPPLGLGGFPFETVEIELPDDSQLVFYTDGLVEDRERCIETVLEELRHTLGHPGRSPEETCQAAVAALPPSQPAEDDVTLLVVRPRGLAASDMACWDGLSPDPAIVSEIRGAVVRQLADWNLEEAAFTTELILSELLTNAIRHATGPFQVRLLRDRMLICEVADTSSTSPHLRQADMTDEGGRGLFLVAQLAQRWGTRYTPRGKVIWAEQPMPAG
ncbi:SpoIIE family protein phosphatase [Streptomyces sp. NPDC050625]|uniref:SpoIIE family protein phosphatase n=1 Tax=Streptomyces sp. NPDC050625 TaxID=3154629 RepID=UPI0034274BC8